MAQNQGTTMKYLSVCSGIEAATVAWHELGWMPAAFSEIEAFPSKVLAHHYPEVKNLGDMTKFEEWNLDAIDLLVGGTPCQSFSVAGLRKGLDDPRGNLMLTYGAIAKRFRPKWLVWENVPGVLSSNDGRDFATFLGMLAELGYGFAYRVLDAQYFGVAQRRRRVFVVGCLGDWRAAAAVLFERDSLSGNPAPSREKGQRITSSSSAGPQYGGSNAECANAVTSKWAKGSGGPSGDEGGLFVAQPMPFQETADCLTASYGTKWNGNASATNGSLFATQSVAFDTRNGMAPHGSMSGDVISPTLRAKEAEPPMVMQSVAHTLRAEYDASEDGTGRGTPLVPVDVPEVMSTLLSSTAGVSRPGNAATEHETYIPMAYRKSKRAHSQDDDETWVDDGVANTVNLFDQGDTRTTHAVVQPIPLNSMNIFRSPEADASTGCGLGEEGEAMFTLTKTNHHAVAQPIAFTSEQTPKVSNDLAHTLTNTTFKHNQMVAQPLNIYGGNKRSDRPEGGFYVRMDEDTSKTLDAASGLNPTANQGGTAVIQPIAFSSNMSVPDCQTDVAPTLKLGGQGGGNPPAIVQSIAIRESGQGYWMEDDKAGTLRAEGENRPSRPSNVIAQQIAPALTTNDPSRSPQASEVTQQIAAVHAASMAVRRLTPRECERLQGFPDDYTNIKENCPDGPRYKALGNSMAVPVMRWIGDRIRMVNELPK